MWPGVHILPHTGGHETFIAPKNKRQVQGGSIISICLGLLCIPNVFLKGRCSPTKPSSALDTEATIKIEQEPSHDEESSTQEKTQGLVK